MRGKAAHGGCCSTTGRSFAMAPPASASSARMTAPAPRSISTQSSSTDFTWWQGMPRRSSRLAMSRASLPVGARMMVRLSCVDDWASGNRGVLLEGRSANKSGHTGEHALELAEGTANGDSSILEKELANSALVGAAAFLDDGNGLAKRSGALEVAEEQDG